MRMGLVYKWRNEGRGFVRLRRKSHGEWEEGVIKTRK